MATKWFPSFKMAVKMFLFSPWAAKLHFGCEMISQPHSYPLWNPPFAVKFKMVVKWFPNFEMGCKNVFLFSFWLRNGLQAMKWFAKTPYKAKEKLQKCQQSLTTMHLRREPHTPWDHTHEASHPIFDLLKPSNPIAPSESSSWGDYEPKETTRTEVKVLIQPTQEATIDTSAPQDLTTTWSSFYFLSLHIILV